MKSRNLLILLLCFLQKVPFAQMMVLDKVIAKVGNEFVLHSEVEEQFSLWSERGVVPDDARCTILESMLVSNLLVHRAQIDSIEVTDEEVEDQLNARMDQILVMMSNDASQFEAYYGVTVTEMKEFNRIDLRKRLYAERMQNQIVEEIKVTPAEVVAYFRQIPKDSMPYFNSEIELGEIVYKPPINDAERARAIAKAEEILLQLRDGADFGELARKYSDDRGSAATGGDLGWAVRGSLVPEFEAAAYKLDTGEVSPIIETEFGFHVIQLADTRRGNSIHAQHILIKPEITEKDLEKARTRLMEIRNEIIIDSISFLAAVKKYSDKKVQSYTNGGRMVNQKTGNTFFETDPEHLDADIFFAIDTIDVGEITGPVEFRAQTGDIIFKLFQLQSRTPPHRANLSQDYSRIQEAARQSKRNQVFNEWIDESIQNTYILVDERYQGCPNLEKWHVRGRS
ncbi:MAG TPA: peptidylprolyl isomerase [Saprospiraceae bacterium]|nr:peptidylprolyl isomerase [Saprospiraceae bacterium]